MSSSHKTVIPAVALGVLISWSGAPGTALATQGTLRGTVYDNGGQRVAYAYVSLSNGVSDLADTLGEYVIYGIDYGTYDLTVRAAGYIAETAQVTIGQYSTVLDITGLQKVSHITGRVTEDGSTPMDSVRVEAMDSSGGSWGGYTDSSGCYSVSLPAGTYTVTAEDTDFRYFTEQANVQVSAGGTTPNVDLRLLGGRINGQVVLWDGSPMSGAKLLVYQGSGVFTFLTADSSGHFDVKGMPAATYTLTASDATQKVVAVASVSVSDQPVQVQVRPGRIVGTVRDHMQTPISGMSVWAAGQYWVYEATTTSQGQYQIDLAAGSYQLLLVPTAVDQVGTVIQGVAVAPGQQTTRDDVLSGPAGGISGHVRNASGSPISGAKVMTWGGSESQAPVYATTVTDGSFTLQHLGSGSYSVAASAQGYELLTQEGLSVQLGQTTTGITLTLQAGQPPSPSPILSGAVRTSGGQGLSGVLLAFTNGGGTATTDSSGAYSREVPTGWTGTVTPSKQGYAFSPAFRSYSSVTSGQQGQDFTSSTLSPLQEALDTTLDVSAGGDSPWFSQGSTSYWGGDALQSGDVEDDEYTDFSATVSGPGTVSFYWSVSSEFVWDRLEFYLDGVFKDRISGDVGWEGKSYTVTGASSHSLTWQYAKDSSDSSGSDCGWVDCLTWTPSP